MDAMKRALAFSFATLGITSLIGQVMLIRELMTVFYGNEFFIGWILFAWFFWVGLGSLATGRWAFGTTRPAQWLIGCHIAITVLLPASIFLARCSRLAVDAVPGVIPDLLPSLTFSLFALAPLCLLLGAQFVIAARAWESLKDRPTLDRILGEGYVHETLGFVIGGIMFGYFFVTTNEFVVIAFLAWLNVFAGSFICALPRNRTLAARLTLVVVSTLTAIVFLLARPINERTARFRFPGQNLLESRNSIYGNLAVTRNAEQHNFFENGLFLAADRGEMANEYTVHFPMLFHRAPKNVLLIGNGFNGALVEILKHNPDRVDYVEIDPELIRLARFYLPADLERVFSDPRVRVTVADGRFFLKRRAATEPLYDVIIVNLPNPSTALINRYFTKEFFAEALSQLKPDGLLSTKLAFSPDYVSRELEDLGASVFRSLQSVFPHVTILPEYEILFIASRHRPALLKERLVQRGVETRFVTDPYISYRLGTDRIPQVFRAFQENATAQVNRDGKPIACFYSLVYWISSFHPHLARIAAGTSRVSAGWMAVAAVLIGALIYGVRRRSAARLPALAMGTGAFSLMVCEVVIILAFQVFYGYLYYRLSLIIAGLMLGMAIGTWAATHVLGRDHRHSLALLHGGIAAYCLAFIFIAQFLAATSVKYSTAIELIFLLLAAAVGALVGFEFPIANKLYLEHHVGDPRKAGVIYGIDLAGSCAGALVAGVWMLPVLGITGTMVTLAVLNTMVAAAAATRN